MSKAVKNIMVRTVKNRLASGEGFEDIIKSYPKLTKTEAGEIQEIIQKENA